MSERREAAKIGFVEFIVLAAAMMSTQAIAIDAMLPAFPVIVRALNVAKRNLNGIGAFGSEVTGGIAAR